MKFSTIFAWSFLGFSLTASADPCLKSHLDGNTTITLSRKGAAVANVVLAKGDTLNFSPFMLNEIDYIYINYFSFNSSFSIGSLGEHFNNIIANTNDASKFENGKWHIKSNIESITVIPLDRDP